MSTTPRTDAAVRLTIGAGFNMVCPNFARQLETELAAAKLDAEDQAKWALWYLARAEKAEAEIAAYAAAKVDAYAAMKEDSK